MKLADINDMYKISNVRKWIGPTIAELCPLDFQNGYYRPCEQRSFFLFCCIFMKLADKNDMHKISDKFEYGSDQTNDGRVMSP